MRAYCSICVLAFIDINMSKIPLDTKARAQLLGARAAKGKKYYGPLVFKVNDEWQICY